MQLVEFEVGGGEGDGDNLLEILGLCVTDAMTDLAEHFGVYLCGMDLICIFVVALLVFFRFVCQK